MKKILILTLSLSLQTILLSASELNWNFDLNTEAVRTAIKGKESYLSVSDSILTFQVPPGRKFPAWRTVTLPLELKKTTSGKPLSIRLAGELKLQEVAQGKNSEGAVLFLRYRQNGKFGFRFVTGFPHYGTTNWLPFSASMKLPGDATEFTIICGLVNVTGTFGIRDLTITETE